MNVYVELTHEFNRGGLRAVLAGGQAVVLHRLAVMSKDGDWVLREDAAATGHVLEVLGRHGAVYRFGAPLDVRWLAGGWSAHLEFQRGIIRVRTDFVSRPPRLGRAELERMWQEQERAATPFAGARELAEMKKTNREKDYAVIGELARVMGEPDDQMLYSRSARDLMRMAGEFEGRMRELAARRPVLAACFGRLEELEAALDAERRQLMHANEARLARYEAAAEPWAACWPEVRKAMEGLPLAEAHAVMSARAEGLLPFAVAGGLA